MLKRFQNSLFGFNSSISFKPLLKVIILSVSFFNKGRLETWLEIVSSILTLSIFVIFCIISIIACIYCLSKAMTVLPVGFTYASYGGLTITAVTLFGIFKYNQTPNIYGIVGLTLIIIGVILLNTLAKTN